MSIGLPLVTRREIVREYRPDGAVTDAAAVRRLRQKGALSAGVSVETRRAHGRLGGRLHLYSALNRDAARAVRQHRDALAVRIGKAAARLERSKEARRLAAALSELGGAATTSQLAQALSTPDLIADASALQAMHQDLRRKLGVEGASTVLAGRVSVLRDDGAILELEGLPSPVAVPRELLEEAGVSTVGDAVSAMWEMLPGGRTLMTIEPALDAAEVNDLGEPLVDLYGTPWGRTLCSADAGAVVVSGRPTVRIPAGIPDIA